MDSEELPYGCVYKPSPSTVVVLNVTLITREKEVS